MNTGSRVYQVYSKPELATLHELRTCRHPSTYMEHPIAGHTNNKRSADKCLTSTYHAGRPTNPSPQPTMLDVPPTPPLNLPCWTSHQPLPSTYHAGRPTNPSPQPTMLDVPPTPHLNLPCWTSHQPLPSTYHAGRPTTPHLNLPCWTSHQPLPSTYHAGRPTNPSPQPTMLDVPPTPPWKATPPNNDSKRRVKYGGE
ncbi:hypothetical protein J4Q44_G00015920 [Coregonus suidteri]|uniref:Uncharacterized protein n=1 Tax=Coregonus suidteri TaxID=861788 RepID=A0AAN8M855_9TELE